MKKMVGVILGILLVMPVVFAAEEKADISDLTVQGKIEGENITFELTFNVETEGRATIPLVAGDVAHLDSKLPRNAELSRQGDVFFMTLRSSLWSGNKQHAEFRFASRPIKEGAWRHTSFTIPASSIRKLSVICDRDDLEVVFPGALNVKRGKNKDGHTEVTAFLGLSNKFAVRWKPSVKKLSAELAVACDANTIASASVGALKIDNIFTFSVVQGTLKHLSLDLPKSLNVTQVRGDDIQDWIIKEEKPDTRRLMVTLSRPKDAIYKLHVESEVVLPKFPCELELPVITPEDVIRSSGFLMIGTDSAIKLIINKALGLTQVDQTSFPSVTLSAKKQASRPLPLRSKFAYQYANMPYRLTLAADDIVPEYSSNERLVLSIKDNDLVFSGWLELDVRDAPAREMTIETDPEWIVANVAGKALSDYDVRDDKNKRLIQIYFSEAVMGPALIDVRLEKALGEDEKSFEVPSFKVLGAKSERGYIVLAGEKGFRLKKGKTHGLREVHTGSVETRVADAQMAYRFKESGWGLSVLLERIKPTIYSEMFHLISIGEGVLYCSSVVTYHIEGAPVRSFRIRIPGEFKNIEFTGHDVRGWQHEGELWTVSLQEKVIGDYTLGFTYDKHFAYKGDKTTIGGVETQGTSSEAGYIVLASSASLNLSLIGKDESIIVIDRDEVPEAYVLLVNDPILKAYKYVAAPHTVKINVQRYDTEQLIDQVADHTTLSTIISKAGEAVTTAIYSIKNLSKQYFVVSLPKGANLWSTRIIDGNGNKQDVSSMNKGDKILIPISRLLNPNIPVRVEVKYAESRSKPGVLGSTLKLRSPVFDETHNTFAKWEFKIPEKYTIARTGGNMTPSSVMWAVGIAGVFADVFRFYWVLFTAFTSWFVLALAFIICACFLAYNHGRKRGLIWRSALSVVVLVVVFIGGAIFSDVDLCDINQLAAFFRLNGEEPHAVAVTKTVSLAATEPLYVKMKIVPNWIGVNGSLGWALIGIALGIWLTLKAIGSERRNLILNAFGLTVISLGVAEVAAGRCVLLFLFAFVAPLLAVIALIRLSHNKGRKMQEEEVFEVDQEPPPPFVENSEEESKDIEEHGSNGVSQEQEEEKGSMRISLLVLLAFLGLCVTGVARTAKKPMPYPPLPAADSVEITVIAPEMDEEAEKSAQAKVVYELELEHEGSFVLLKSPAVLREYSLNSKYLEMNSSPQGYFLTVRKKGKYEVMLDYSVPVNETEGTWFINLMIPANLSNKVILRIPGKELDIESPEAVLLKTAEKEKATEALLVYGAATQANISWHARVRKTKLEKTVFFCEANTLAVFEPGVVDLTHLISYQIAQGEIKTMTLTVPKGMSVTAVRAPGLSTWRFDPETRLLEAILEKSVSGDFTLHVVSQIACEGLPYDVAIGALQVKDTARQRGAIALAVPETVQIQVDEIEGLNPMNIEDFSQQTLTAAQRGIRARRPVTNKRAFRYHSLPVSAKVRAERVIPEIRVVENSSLSVADERVVLSSQLGLTISKAGIFSAHLGIPEGFDVETLSGQDISHWDEVGPDDGRRTTDDSAEKERGRGVIVHFKKQALGRKTINFVIARTEKGIAETIDVPRIEVKNALKHTGTMVVSGERGVRMSVKEREGASEINPRDLGINQTGVLAFKLLRPEWLIKLKAEVVAPTIRSEVLQRVDLSEGMMQGTAYVRYEINHAGCKQFRVQAPSPGVALAITGRDISKVNEVDKERGIWEAELHNKVENNFFMEVRYQISGDTGNEKVRIMPVRTLGIESQKGYLVIMPCGRIQVRPTGGLAGLKPENARSIPGYFGAGDLSDAIYCYRTVSGEYELELSAVRHDTANVLPASIKSVRMTSVASDGRQVLTRVVLDMTVGNLQFLEMELPHEDSTLWTAFVKGKAASVSRDKNIYRIPLEEPVSGESTTVEFVYADSAYSRFLSRRQEYKGPKFIDLPLQDIQWDFYVVPGRRYYGFGGTMEFKKAPLFITCFDAQSYDLNNLRIIEGKRAKAKSIMKKSQILAKQGHQMQARKALESAVNYSQSDMAFNEDARIQYKNLAEQQAVVGLVQRRDEMRYNRNIQEAGQIERMQEFKGGQFTAKYAAKVQESLSEGENRSLMETAEKILDQQAAAQRIAQTINITMPMHGRRLLFKRSLQIDPESDMIVSFKAGSGAVLRCLLVLLAATVMMIAYRFALGARILRYSG